jgi:hypothetical protein
MYAMGIAGSSQKLVALGADTSRARREQVKTGAMTKVAEETQ